MNNRGWMALLALGVLALLTMDSFFIVNQTEKAVLKQFSRIDKTDIEPGLYCLVNNEKGVHRQKDQYPQSQ